MFLRRALRIAWRELHATPAKFLFVILAVAIGVGALSGVKGFGYAFRGMLLRNAKQLTAADLQAQIWAVPTPEMLAKLRAVGGKVWLHDTSDRNRLHGGGGAHGCAAASVGESGGPDALSFLWFVNAAAAGNRYGRSCAAMQWPSWRRSC